MGYFAGRAAPLGQVGPSVVSAIFFNFHESMVHRSIPEAWEHAGCPAILRARRAAAATALRRILPSVEERAVELAPLCRRVVESADGSGRPLFSANRDLEEPDDPVEALWQGCTSLREHRGDGHVVALTAAGLDGCEALVLFSASEDVPATVFRESRGWSGEEWEGAQASARCPWPDGGRSHLAGRSRAAAVDRGADRRARRRPIHHPHPGGARELSKPDSDRWPVPFSPQVRSPSRIRSAFRQPAWHRGAGRAMSRPGLRTADSPRRMRPRTLDRPGILMDEWELA